MLDLLGESPSPRVSQPQPRLAFPTLDSTAPTQAHSHAAFMSLGAVLLSIAPTGLCPS